MRVSPRGPERRELLVSAEAGAESGRQHNKQWERSRKTSWRCLLTKLRRAVWKLLCNLHLRKENSIFPP